VNNNNILRVTSKIYTCEEVTYQLHKLENVYSGNNHLRIVIGKILLNCRYLELPVVLISVSNTMQPAIYIPPFQAAIDLAM